MGDVKSVVECFGLGLNIGIGIQHHDHRTATLHTLQIIRHYAGTFIGPGWATVGRFGHGYHKPIMVAHRRQLLFE